MSVDEIGRKRRRKPGDITALRRTLWAALLEIEDLLAEPDPNMKLRAGHCLATLSGSYMKLLEQAELTTRLEALEAQLGTAPTSIRRVSWSCGDWSG